MSRKKNKKEAKTVQASSPSTEASSNQGVQQEIEKTAEPLAPIEVSEKPFRGSGVTFFAIVCSTILISFLCILARFLPVVNEKEVGTQNYRKMMNRESATTQFWIGAEVPHIESPRQIDGNVAFPHFFRRYWSDIDALIGWVLMLLPLVMIEVVLGYAVLQFMRHGKYEVAFQAFTAVVILFGLVWLNFNSTDLLNLFIPPDRR